MGIRARSSRVLVAVALSLFLFAGQAGAFCVHNYTDREIFFQENSNCSTFKCYSSKLIPGSSGCCNWADGDCNKSGGKYDLVGFHVYYYGNNITGQGIDVCPVVTIPACSDLDVTGSNGHYKCVPHAKETCN